MLRHLENSPEAELHCAELQSHVQRKEQGSGWAHQLSSRRPCGSWQRLHSLDWSPFVKEKAEAQGEKGSGRPGDTSSKHKIGMEQGSTAHHSAGSPTLRLFHLLL